MKHYIYTHKWKKIAVSFAAFLEHLKYQTKIEKEIEKISVFQVEMADRWKFSDIVIT